MKLYFYLLVFTLCIACKSKTETSTTNTTATTNTENQQGPEYTSKFVCPMHCKGSGSDAAGVCPTCGMDYVENKSKDGHEGHDHDHDGHDDHEGHNH
ncbi:MAG: hypothetical protein RLZZ546_3047 [Bacteroidota bacterium]|jgi:predicted nucleic acid binding AN1-type Zn finger protein